jgi:hypothetical protein
LLSIQYQPTIIMTLQEYKVLHTEDQARYLRRKGVSIGERTVGPYLVILYAIESFYVETFYDKDSLEMVKLVSFYNTALLEPYLKTIDISVLY